MNLSQQIKDIKLPDLPQAIKDLKFWPSQSSIIDGVDSFDMWHKETCPLLATAPGGNYLATDIDVANSEPPPLHITSWLAFLPSAAYFISNV